MRVGRAALDEEAIRLIEEHNPDVDFDWTRILKGQPEEAETQPVRPRKSEKPERAEKARRPDSPESVETPVEPAPDVETADELDQSAIGEELTEPTGYSEAAHQRLGSEGLARLRARYAEVLARISERTQDPAQREQLKSQAERLNPDTWVTAEEVARGIEEYESVFATLRAAVGGRSRRRRRRRAAADAPAGEDAPQATETPDDSDGAGSGDDDPL